MVRYAAPMMTNQPGNIIISAYDPQIEAASLKAREDTIARDYEADKRLREEQNSKYNTGTIIWVTCLIIGAIIFAIWEASIWW